MSSPASRSEDIRRILETRIQDLLHELPPFLKVTEETPIEVFIDAMKLQGANVAVVVGRNGRITGIVTRLDLLKILELETRTPQRLRVLALPKLPKPGKIKVGDIMTENPVTLGETARVRDAVDLMSKYRISNIIIVDSKGDPKAVFSKKYLLKKIFGVNNH